MSPDGFCKAPRVAKVAVSDDGLPPLCPETLAGLAKFVSCGLGEKIKSMPHATFRPPAPATIRLDSSTNKTLYLVKIVVDVPVPYQDYFAASTSSRESTLNWRHLEILAKSFKEYRLSHKLCTGAECTATKSEAISEGKSETSTRFDSYRRSSNVLTRSFQQVEESLGPIVDKQNTTTFCMSPMNMLNYYVDAVFVCRESPVYELDSEAIGDFRSSPCFIHLDNIRLARSRGRNNFADKGMLLQILLQLIMLSYMKNFWDC